MSKEKEDILEEKVKGVDGGRGEGMEWNKRKKRRNAKDYREPTITETDPPLLSSLIYITLWSMICHITAHVPVSCLGSLFLGSPLWDQQPTRLVVVSPQMTCFVCPSLIDSITRQHHHRI